MFKELIYYWVVSGAHVYHPVPKLGISTLDRPSPCDRKASGNWTLGITPRIYIKMASGPAKDCLLVFGGGIAAFPGHLLGRGLLVFGEGIVGILLLRPALIRTIKPFGIASTTLKLVQPWDPQLMRRPNLSTTLLCILELYTIFY